MFTSKSWSKWNAKKSKAHSKSVLVSKNHKRSKIVFPTLKNHQQLPRNVTHACCWVPWREGNFLNLIDHTKSIADMANTEEWGGQQTAGGWISREKSTENHSGSSSPTLDRGSTRPENCVIAGFRLARRWQVRNEASEFIFPMCVDYRLAMFWYWLLHECPNLTLIFLYN